MIEKLCAQILENPIIYLCYIAAFFIVGSCLLQAAIKCKNAYWIGHDHSKEEKAFSIAGFVSCASGTIILCFVVGIFIAGPSIKMLRSPPIQHSTNNVTTIATSVTEASDTFEKTMAEIINEINLE